MTRYFTTINGHGYEFEISSEGEVTLDGRQLRIDFRAISGLPVYSLLLDAQSYQAVIEPAQSGLAVHLRGRLYQATVEDETQRLLRETAGAFNVGSEEFKLKAPMPGMVVAVPVANGQQVKKGQDLVILESMKMQNELKAPRPGMVCRVLVQAGDNVDQNQVMVILE
jgi:biotin carboxyl carrier protein